MHIHIHRHRAAAEDTTSESARKAWASRRAAGWSHPSKRGAEPAKPASSQRSQTGRPPAATKTGSGAYTPQAKSALAKVTKTASYGDFEDMHGAIEEHFGKKAARQFLKTAEALGPNEAWDDFKSDVLNGHTVPVSANARRR